MKDSKSHPSRVAEHVRDIPRSGIRDFFDVVAGRPDVLSLGIGEPDFVTPWAIREGAVEALNRGATSYTSNLGLLSLRRAIAGYVSGAYGAQYDPDTEILVTVGVSEALDLAVRAVLNPGDEVLIHEPSYVSYGPVVIFAQGKPVYVRTHAADGFRLHRADLERKATSRTRVLMLNFPTNPTGGTLARGDVEAIAAFAIERDLIVITDEIYSELTYEGERVSVASVPGMKERTIFLHGFSKAWAMTGFRIGYACAPQELTEAMMKIHQYTMLCAPILSQEAAIEALKNAPRFIEPMRESYRERRNFLHQSLNEVGIPCHKPSGAFYAFPHIAGFGLSSREFALKLLDEEKVACVPGTAFGPAGEGFLRCCYATDIETLKEAVARMGRFVARLRR